jgi:putative aldouronate transport system permease protein
MVKYLHMKDNYLALLIPLLFNVFNMIIIRTFMSSLPESLGESAKIDGAGDFMIFAKIILPLSKPVLATISLFTALAYWNDWVNAMLYIQDSDMIPLQYYLYKVLSVMEFIKNAARTGANIHVDVPQESYKLAMTVVTTGPIIFLYPLLQKYFIKGLTVGAVKG